jgi:hypothetical protein
MTIPSEKVPCEYIEAPLAITTITPPSGCGVTTISNFLRYGKKPSFSIRPNPSDGNLQIQTTLRGDVNIYIYDMLGSVVAVKQFTIKEKDTPLDLTSLRPGTYFVRAGNSDTFLENKLLISK